MRLERHAGLDPASFSKHPYLRPGNLNWNRLSQVWERLRVKPGVTAESAQSLANWGDYLSCMLKFSKRQNTDHIKAYELDESFC